MSVELPKHFAQPSHYKTAVQRSAGKPGETEALTQQIEALWSRIERLEKMLGVAGTAVQIAGSRDAVLNAGDELHLRCGQASISMKKDGTVSIKGRDITISGDGKVNVKASGELVMKGLKISQN
jgi:hypothetical protein